MNAFGRILFIAPSAYPVGGVATWLDYIAPGLRKRDWSVTLGLLEGRFHDVDAYLSLHPSEKVLRIPLGTGTREGRVRQLLHAISGVRPHILVTVHVPDVVTAVERIRAAGKSSPRVVFTLHAVQADFVSSIGDCAGVLDAVVCTNRLACELVARNTSIEPDRIYYAPCGVDLNFGVATHQRDPENLLRIVYVGRLDRVEKRIEDIIAVVAELNRRGVVYEFVIAGSGPDEGWLRERLADVARGGKVRLLGAIANMDVAEQVYSGADALLITSSRETGPIVAWEAMANRVAVVTSAYVGSGLEGSLRDGENCLMFPIGNAIVAVDCLERLRDPELRNHLVRGGLSLVTARYSKPASIEQWASCFSRIVARSPLPYAQVLQETTRGSPAGRLDRLFGARVGENIRERLGLKYNHSEPGGEWPHATTNSQMDEEMFWQLAVSLDRRSHLADRPDA